MYIFKNAMRCISRSLGRNILIGIIVLVISVSACIGLSIRRSAEKAKDETLDNMSVTASISFDRMSAMQNMTPPSEAGERPEGGFDRDGFSSMMGQSSALTLEEYRKYAAAETVDGFYYTSTASLNGDDSLLPVSNESSSDSEESNASNGFGGFGSMGGMGGFGGRDFIKGADSDFSLIGVSGEAAMTDFINGTAAITDGEIFAENSSEMNCIISSELALYNDLSVGSRITLLNPNNEEESYEFTVVGIFEDSSANENSFSPMGMTASDPANKIYIGYAALSKLLSASDEASQTVTSESGREFETAITENLSATYTFKSVEDYEKFCEDVYELGLGEEYTVSSSDITAFENSLVPLETLSVTAGYFLLVILVIGAVILVVLNIFSVRERKYEIGVLTAMGMKKRKVALQFLTEIFAITLAAVIIGGGIGAAVSVPVANTLLEGQIESQSQNFEMKEQSFGRTDRDDMQMPSAEPPQGGDFGGRFESFAQNTVDYVDEISSATDVVVLLELLGIAVLLTVVAGGFSVMFIMRYEPLKILSNRD